MLIIRTVLLTFLALVLTTNAWARPALSELSPSVGLNYQPSDKDEKGIWRQLEQLEQSLQESDLLVRDLALNAYLQSVINRVLGDYAGDIRLYVVHDPDFNATMAPNGMMVMHTGLLVRVRNEAQLAAVIGHEAGHYLRQHTLKHWRDAKTKSGVIAFVSVGATVATGLSGENWYDLADSINQTLVLSLFSHSREQESEADAYGLKLMAAAGYAPQEASAVWSQLNTERRASAAQRGKRFRDNAKSAFSTHPPNEERLSDLAELASELPNDSPFDEGADRWSIALGPLQRELLEEQVKLNDPGASLYLIESHASDGWDGMLRYLQAETFRLRAEPDDAKLAGQAYADAVLYADCPPEALKMHGYALIKAEQRNEGQQFLQRYLELKPTAPDAALTRSMLAN